MENEILQDVILQLAALSGEISQTAVMRLDSSEKYLMRVLKQMQKDNLIIRCDNDRITGYRLSQSGKKYLVQQYPKRYGNYFGRGGITTKIRLDNLHRRRYLWMSEINVMMYNTDSVLFPRDKPPFDQRTVNKTLAVGDESEKLSQSYYYTAFEIKEMGEEAIKINASRMMGLLKCSRGAYLVYNSRTDIIKWEEMTERRAEILLGHKTGMPTRSIMMGADINNALTLLNSNGGKQNRYFKLAPDCRDNMYYIPQNRDGEFQLRYSILSDANDKLREKLLAGVDKENGSCTLPCDGFADEKTGILFACDFDMIRIMKFKIGIEIRKMNGIVFCLDYQADVLKEYFGENVTLRVIDSGKLSNMMGIKK